ncbi:MAG: YdcF family protein [Acidobacteriales bacterium]|nr:YdcF family protein [Terriglobales bacterium]
MFPDGTLMRKTALSLAVMGTVLAVFAASARFLVVDRPQKADVILVLAGETDRRPARGLELLDRGYAPTMVLDVPGDAKIFQWSETDLAQKYVATLPEAASVTICPIYGLSTKAEAKEASRCLDAVGAHKILLVTSDFHTRRALGIFRHDFPGRSYTVAAAYDPSEFGMAWWRRREWAKTDFYEWLRLLWWEAVDRWKA